MAHAPGFTWRSVWTPNNRSTGATNEWFRSFVVWKKNGRSSVVGVTSSGYFA